MGQHFYPIVLTDNIVRDTNFYEDFFNFQPELEMDCFVILRHAQKPEMRLALMDQNHKTIPDSYKRSAQGIILSLPVDDVAKIYGELFDEGLELHSEPSVAPCGRRHFLVTGPGGVLIDVMEQFDPFAGMETLPDIDAMNEKGLLN